MCKIYVQIPPPYLKHMSGAAALSTITNDLLTQLVFAVYLNHIQNICLPCSKNRKAQFSLNVLTTIAKIIFFLFASHISTTSGDF